MPKHSTVIPITHIREERLKELLAEHNRTTPKFKIRYRPLNDKFVLYIDLNVNGRRKREAVAGYWYGLPNSKRADKKVIETAILKANEKRLEYLKDRNGFVIDEKQAKVKLTNFIKTVAEQKSKDGIKVLYYQTLINHINAAFRGELILHQFSQIHAEKFRQYLLSKVSRNSARLYFTILTIVFNEAVSKKYIIKNPINSKELRIKKEETKRAYLVIDEIRILKNTPAPNEETARAFLFACFTGLRYSDIINLKWKNIVNGEIDIFVKKTNRELRIPISKTAAAILEEHRRSHPIVPANGRIFIMHTVVATNNQLKRWATAAGINKNVTWHVARHTFATMNITAGNDIFTLQKLLDHKSVATTQIYAKVIDAVKKKAIDNLPEL